MQRSRSKITRDVRLVFDLFVDKATGATPGQSYVVQYERGDRERGQSEPVKADAKGDVKFSFHSAFVSTLQRKNAMQYTTKNFRIFVTEHPGSLVVADTTYNLASSVDNEIFPSKTFLIRSKEKALKLTFTLSGMSEDDIRQQSSLAGGPDSPSVTRPTAESIATLPPRLAHCSRERDDTEEAASSIRRQDTQPSDRSHKTAPTTTTTASAVDSDDDLFAMVDSAVAEKSARSEVSSAATPNSSRVNRSVAPSEPPKVEKPAVAAPSTAPAATAAFEVENNGGGRETSRLQPQLSTTSSLRSPLPARGDGPSEANRNSESLCSADDISAIESIALSIKARHRLKLRRPLA